MEAFKNIDWKHYIVKGLGEAVYTILFFLIMHVLLGWVLSFQGDQLDPNLKSSLITITTIILYFLSMDQRKIDEKFVNVNEKIDSISEQLDEEDFNEFTDQDLEDMIQDIQMEIDERSKI